MRREGWFILSPYFLIS